MPTRGFFEYNGPYYFYLNGNWHLADHALSITSLEPEHSVPDVSDIIFNGDTTIVIWSDGEKTVVTKEEGKPNDPYAAFCAAVCKRLFGSTDKVMKIIETADRAKKAARRKEEAKRLKELHRREDGENAAKNKKLANRMFDAMVEREIRHREIVKKVDEIMGARK